MQRKAERVDYNLLKGMLAVLAVIGMLAAEVQAQNLDVPYVPTPQPVVDRMLEVTGVDQGDYVIDLGSGDGRIVISAARRGAVGHGVDLDPKRISEARENAAQSGVDDRVVFLQEDIFETDISQASVITMYLLTSVNRKLRPRLFEDLRPGTQVVSHSFSMGDWEPDSTIRMNDSTGRLHTIYYWVMPASVGGTWSWQVEGEGFELSVGQRYQKIQTMELEAGGDSVTTDDAVVNGRRFSFVADREERRYVFSGRVSGDTITGTVQIHEGGESDRIRRWEAIRR